MNLARHWEWVPKDTEKKSLAQNEGACICLRPGLCGFPIELGTHSAVSTKIRFEGGKKKSYKMHDKNDLK